MRAALATVATCACLAGVVILLAVAWFGDVQSIPLIGR